MRDERAGGASAPSSDPAGARTFDDIAQQLRILKAWAGDPSYRVIHKRIIGAREERGVAELPALSTVYECFAAGRKRLDIELVVDIVRALGCGDAQTATWRQACSAVAGRAALSAVVSAADTLPDDLLDFAGRRNELDALRGLRVTNNSETTLVIEGMAGTGKTVLAIHLAHSLLAQEEFNQVLFANLRSFHPDPSQPPADPGAVLDHFLRLLGVSGHKIPQDQDRKAAMYRERLRSKRVLTVLDDAVDNAQVAPLLMRNAHGITIITSRNKLTSLPKSARFPLDVFSAEDALEYLQIAVGEARIVADLTTAQNIADGLGRHPLALGQFARHMLAHDDWTLNDHLERIHDHRRNRKLDEAVEISFRMSYEDLDQGPRRLLRVLALDPCPDIDIYAAAALANADTSTAQRHLDSLVARNLIRQKSFHRYEFHDLVQRYALARADDEERGVDRRHAVIRLLDYFLYTAATAMNLAFPAERNRRPEIPEPAISLPLIPDVGVASHWLQEERVNLVSVAAFTATYDWPEYTGRLAIILRRFLDINAYYSEALTIHRHALHASRRVNDRAGEAIALQNLGTVYWQTGSYTEALDNLERALALHRESGNQTAEANTLDNIGGVFWELGRPEAIEYYIQALHLNRLMGNRSSESRTLNNLGVVHLRLGHYDSAVNYLEQALVLARDSGDQAARSTLNNLGVAYARLGLQEQAIDHIKEALQVSRDAGFRAGEAASLDSLGLAFRLIGRHDDAFIFHQQALTLAREIGDSGLEVDILNSAAETLCAANKLDEARSYHDSALAVAREHGNRYEYARALDGIGVIQRRLGHIEDARTKWQEALAIYIELHVPEAEKVQADLEDIN